jgi:long-chain acyl-CoA synthetase
MTESFETLSELLEQKAAKFKNNDLFGTKQPDESWRWITYGDFRERVARCRGGLAAKGVGAGDRVAIVSDNSVEWATAAFACYGLGAIFVPMYPAQPKNEWEFILADSGAKLVIAGNADSFDYLAPVVERSATLEHIAGIHLSSDDPRSFAALLEVGAETPAPLAEVKGSDVAGFIYTSGTTGDPKGVVLTHKNFTSNVIASGSRFEFSDEDRALCFLPRGASTTGGRLSYRGRGAAVAKPQE